MARLFAAILGFFFFYADGYAIEESAGENVMLGMLEDVPGVFAHEADSPAIRVIFQKIGAEWLAYPSQCPNAACLENAGSKYPPQVKWNILFNGRGLGQLTAQTPKGFKFYSHIGLQQITSTAPIPVIGQKHIEYSGYVERLVHRPLVANSKAFFKDPEFWKPARLTTDYVRLLQRQFRHTFPALCKTNPQDETKLEPFPYKDEDIRVIQAFRSKKNWVLGRLRLKQAIDCNNTEAGFGIYDQWFVLDSEKYVKYLDEGMWLVDAGDYDHSGKDALVFSLDRDNRGGYELFYDDFKKHALFIYNYH